MKIKTLVFAGIGSCFLVAVCLYVIERIVEPQSLPVSQSLVYSKRLGNNNLPDYNAHRALERDQSQETAESFESAVDRNMISLGRKNIDDAVNYISTYYPENLRQQAIGLLMFELSKEKLERLTAISPLLTSTSERSIGIGMVADYWAKKNLPELLEFADNKMPVVQRNEVYGQAVTSLAKGKEFESARKVLSRMPFSTARTNAISVFGRRLARSDPDGAISWVTTFESAEDIATAGRATASALAENQDVSGLMRLASLVPEELRSAVLKQAGSVSGNSGSIPIAGRDGVADVGEQSQMLVGAVDTVPPTMLTELTEKILAIPESVLRQRGIAAVAGRMFDSDLQATVEWINTLRDENRNAAIGSLVAHWYNVDSLALSDWVNQLPKGQQRDTALAALFWQVRTTDRDTAKQLAETISDNKLRSNLLRSFTGK